VLFTKEEQQLREGTGETKRGAPLKDRRIGVRNCTKRESIVGIPSKGKEKEKGRGAGKKDRNPRVVVAGHAFWGFSLHGSD